MKGHRDSIVSASYSPDGKRVVTASWDKTARIWDTSQETRSAEQIGKLLRCYLPVHFEPAESNGLVWRNPDPTDCQGPVQTIH